MLLSAGDSALIVVDMQARLVPALAESERLTRRVTLLLRAARRLEVPVLATEQSPESIGHTVESVAEFLPVGAVFKKTCFAASREPEISERVAALRRRRLVLCGAEAHVCVLQTALGFVEAGYAVAVAADAVASRREEDRQVALTRMQAAGVEPTTSEMAVFEWLERADTEAFREMIPHIKAD